MKKRAEIRIASVSVSCPKCHEIIPEPSSGSHVWEASDLKVHAQLAEIISCPACGIDLNLTPPVALRAHGL